MSARLLIVEDDPKLLKLLQSDFELEGYTVFSAKDGEEALEMVKRVKPVLLILDVMIPKISGFDVCRTLRKQGHDVLILMLTAKGQETEKVIGLELGADDYMTKPFGGMELLARVKALLRRRRTASAVDSVQIDDLAIDFKAMEVRRSGKPLDLTAKEFQILQLLIAHRGHVIKRETFLEEVWGYTDLPATRTVDTQVMTLRQKLSGKKRPSDYFIQTVHSVGYKFVR